MEEEKQLEKRYGLGVALVLVSTFCLSTEAIAAKIAYQGGANVMTALTLRYILAATVFWLLIPAGKYVCRLTGQQLLKVTILTLSTQLLTVLALFEAFRYIPSAIAILFLYFYPTVVAILAFFFLKEPFTGRKVLALLLTFSGCAIILGQPVNGLDPRGVILSLAAAFTNAVFMVGTARLLNDIQTPVYNAYISTILALAVGLIALAGGQFRLAFNLQAIIAIAVLGIITTVVALAALFRGIKEIGPFRASVISTFEPAATAVLGFLLLGEGLTIWQIAGGVVVLSGVLIMKRPA